MLANIVCCVLNFYHPGLQVRLVGRMLNKLDRVTDVSFTLDDGTGRVPVNRWWDAMYRFIVLNKLWIISWLCTDFYFFLRENDSTDTKEMADIQNGDYVIVNGGLKGFQGKRQVVAYSVR
jgi:replication factor A2